ncbi:hypothetical protein BDQ17DRAFT_1435551 [Cyathus striatus]|nr:hypothetical protein BDQ17DRAFT_1435551 [Cyathus striatus]
MARTTDRQKYEKALIEAFIVNTIAKEEMKHSSDSSDSSSTTSSSCSDSDDSDESMSADDSINPSNCINTSIDRLLVTVLRNTANWLYLIICITNEHFITSPSSSSPSAQSPDSDTAPSSSNSTTLKPGIIALIAILSALLILIITILLTLFFYKKHLRNQLPRERTTRPSNSLFTSRQTKLTPFVRGANSGGPGEVVTNEPQARTEGLSELESDESAITENESQVSYSTTFPPSYRRGSDAEVQDVLRIDVEEEVRGEVRRKEG